MKTNVYSLEGKALKQIEVPHEFSEAFREDLIKRAVLSDESKLYQPKGNYKFAGLETSAKYRGRKEMYGAIKNKGISHLPHEVQPKGNFGKVKRVPQAVKGRRAHPPKPEKILIEKMNKKEYRKAMRSALCASSSKEIVAKRHNSSFDVSFPLVLDNSFENVKKTRDVLNILKALKLDSFVEKIKAKHSKGGLVVVENKNNASENISGFDVVTVNELRVRHLAPGCSGGRLVIFTEKSMHKLAEMVKQ